MTQEHKSNVRGDKTTLTWTVSGDISGRKIIWVLKSTKELGSDRLITKKNTLAGGGDSQLTAVYSAVTLLTTITVYLLTTDTYDLVSKKYYYDITSESDSDSADHITILYGDHIIIADVQNPLDGTNYSEDARYTSVNPLDYSAKWVGKLSQITSSAPSVEEISVNTLGGTVVWTRVTTGTYTGTLTGAFGVDADKFHGRSFVNRNGLADDEWNCFIGWASANTVTLLVWDTVNVLTDNFNKLQIEIEIYP